jgi:hypothetical protein
MIIITIINSMIVKPRAARHLRLASVFDCSNPAIDLPNQVESGLPVRIFRSVERRARRLAINVEDVLASPRR